MIELFPLSEEEARTLSIVYESFQKANLDTIIAKRQRKEFADAIQSILAVPEVWNSKELAIDAILAYNGARFEETPYFRWDIREFLQDYTRIGEVYKSLQRRLQAQG